MSTTVIDTQHAARTPAHQPHAPARTATLILLAFAAVYVVWGSTYLAIRIGIESFPPLILAGLRHTTVGLFLYPILRRKTGIKPTAANWRTAIVTGALLLFVGIRGKSSETSRCTCACRCSPGAHAADQEAAGERAAQARYEHRSARGQGSERSA